MRALIGVFACCLFLGLPLAAAAQTGDDPGRETRRALAVRAVEAMQAEQMSAQISQMMQALPDPDRDGLPPRERAALQEVQTETLSWMMGRMMEGMVDIYADLFTLEELEAMVAFYESPIGRSIMDKSLQATSPVIELTRSLLPEMMRRMLNGMCDRLGCTDAERAEILNNAMASLGLRES